jgi:predicted nucleic acid-binding protein
LPVQYWRPGARTVSDAEHYEVARDWVGRCVTPLRTLDALHLAVCFASDAVLLTADVNLAKAGRHFHVPTELLKQAG